MAAPPPVDSGVDVVGRLRLPARHERDLELLARLATDFVDLPPDEDILAFAGRRLWELVGDAVVAVSEVDPATRRLRCRAVFGAEEVRAAWRTVAAEMTGIEAEVNDVALEAMSLGQLVPVPGGLDLLTFGFYSPEVARKLESVIGFREAYAMGLTIGHEVYGSVVIVARAGTDFPAQRVVEAFVNQAAAALRRRRAEEALRDSERRFRELADQLPQTVVEVDRQGRVLFANRHGLRDGGVGPGAPAGGINVLDGVAPADRERVAATLQRVIEGETVLGVEYGALRLDGTPYHVACYASPIERGGEVVGVRAIAIDVTERKQAEASQQRLEAQLQHAEKLESLAVLAGGLAHDYNNLLVAILGNAELALSNLKPGSVSFERVRKIQNAARRAAELTDQLLDYSGRRHFALQAVALNDIVRAVCAFPQGVLASPGTLALELAEELPAIEGDPAQVRQVLANLLSNAAEAIAGQAGTVTVRTGTVRGDHPSLHDAQVGGDLLPGEYVYLEVADTGSGMDEATRARVFDPFFTTKFPGRGLGLAAVLGIVRTHRGAILLDSAVAHGTCFRVLFRLAAAPAAGRAPG